MITEQFSESNQSASARSVYVALCELSSDYQNDTFRASKALIAHKSGVSVSTVQRLLNIFEKFEVVHVERGFLNGVKAANTYTLLPIGHSYLSMRHSDLSIGHRLQQAFNPDKDKEYRKIVKKKKKNDDTRAPARTRETRTTVPPSSQSSSSSNSVLNLEAAQMHPLWRQFKAFCTNRNGLPTLKGFTTWLKSQPSLPKSKSSLTNNDAYEALLRSSQARADAEVVSHGK